MIDAHQHFWHFDPHEYPWINEKLAPLRRNFLPSDLEPELAAVGFEGCIAVQARSSLAESRWLLSLADSAPIIKGVVGWVDLRSGTVDKDLAELARHPRFVGVRHVLQDEPDDQFMFQRDFQRGLGKLQDYQLTYDLLIFPHQLPAALALAGLFPHQPLVVDHLAKPTIRDATLSPWREQMRDLARHKNVFCKVSGLVTEANWNSWQATDFHPYMDVIFEAFGEDRIMFGSDWPVCLVAASYQQVFAIVHDYFSRHSAAVRQKIFGQNAARFYAYA